jgi:hypothetical protein
MATGRLFFSHFNYVKNVPKLFRITELTLIIVLFLMARYGGLFHLGADPPVNKDTELKDVGAVPWGWDARTTNFGEFVVAGHLYAFSLTLCSMLVNEMAPLLNFMLNLIGAFFFMVLSAIQFNAWRGFLEARERYRELTGFYPFWHDPTIPRIMGFLALLIGILLLMDTGISILSLTRDVRHKRARFNKQQGLGTLGSRGNQLETSGPNITVDSVGGISGTLSVPASETRSFRGG